jgi:dihydrofolate reductase
MQWFRKNTMGKPIIMGRLTFESFGAKPLPGRRNIIISRDSNYGANLSESNIEVYTSIKSALDNLKDMEEVMIIGGMSLYEQALPVGNRLYMTLVHADVKGDAWFPEFDPGEWNQISRIDHEADESNPYPYSFVILDRKETTDLEKMFSEPESPDV